MIVTSMVVAVGIIRRCSFGGGLCYLFAYLINSTNDKLKLSLAVAVSVQRQRGREPATEDVH